MVILLKQFKPIGSKDPDPIPFCTKAESFLKYNNIDYRQVPGDIRQTPKGKFPVAEIDGKEIGDSEIILNVLSKKFDIHMDAHLSSEQKATSYAVKKLFEEYLYFITVYFR